METHMSLDTISDDLAVPWQTFTNIVNYKRAAFAEVHTGHSGRNITISYISKAYVWRNIKKEVSPLIEYCSECRKTTKLKTQAPEFQNIKKTRPLQKVGIDLVGKFNPMYVTCLFSKWVELYLLLNKSCPEVAQKLHSFSMRHGAPESFILDQDHEFVNEVNTALFGVFEVRYMDTTAYHPQTNGQAESTNKVAKDRFRKLTNDQQND